MQDFSLFRYIYLNENIGEEFDFTTWRQIFNHFSTNYLCSEKLAVNQRKLKLMGKFHDEIISRYPIPVIAVLCSRLAEIGVRTTFFIIVSTAALLFKELEERVKELAENTKDNVEFNKQGMSKDLDEWKSHYDLVVRFVKRINRCFSFILLLTSSIDFVVAANAAQNILLYSYSKPRYYYICLHTLQRNLIILLVSNQVESKVNNRF